MCIYRCVYTYIYIHVNRNYVKHDFIGKSTIHGQDCFFCHVQVSRRVSRCFMAFRFEKPCRGNWKMDATPQKKGCRYWLICHITVMLDRS